MLPVFHAHVLIDPFLLRFENKDNHSKEEQVAHNGFIISFVKVLLDWR